MKDIFDTIVEEKPLDVFDQVASKDIFDEVAEPPKDIFDEITPAVTEAVVDTAKKTPIIGPMISLFSGKPKGVTEKQDALLDTVVPADSMGPIMGPLMKTETGKRIAANFAQGVTGSAGSMASSIPALEAYLNVETPVGKTAQDVSDHLNSLAKELAPEDPNFVDQVVSGAGSMALFMLPGAGTQAVVASLPRFGLLAAKMAPALGASASAILESATEAGSVYNDQIKKGINKDTASKAAFHDFWANAVLVGLTNRFGVFGDKFTGLKKALTSAPLEGLQEAGQSILSSVTKDEEINWEDVATSAGVGAIIGGGVGGAMPGETKESPKTTLDEKTIGKEGLAYLSNRFPGLSKEALGQTLPLDSKQAHETIVKASAVGEEVLLRGGSPLEAEQAATAEFKRSIEALKPVEPIQPVAPPQESTAVKVSENVAGQLEKAGYDKETAGTYSKIYEKAFDTLGKRAGIDPLELFSKYGLKIERQGKKRISESQIQAEAQSLYERANEEREGQIPEIERFVKENGGIAAYREDAQGQRQELAEYKNVPARLRGSVPYDEMVQKAKDAGILPPDAGYGDLYEALNSIYERGTALKVDDFYEEAKRNLENEEVATASEVFEQEQKPVFKGYMGSKDNNLPIYNVGKDTWSAETLKEKGIPIPETPTFEEWEKNPKQFEQAAYHGSPHKFDKFSLQKIGTGEGAQAYGWGLYFAGKKEVAEYYKKSLSDGVTIKKENGDSMTPEEMRALYFTPGAVIHSYGGQFDRVISYQPSTGKEDWSVTVQGMKVKNGGNWRKASDWENNPRERIRIHGTEPSAKEYAEDLSERGFQVEPRGTLYKVEIPEDNEYLDWDKPLSKQSEKVRKAIADIINPKVTTRPIGSNLTDVLIDGESLGVWPDDKAAGIAKNWVDHYPVEGNFVYRSIVRKLAKDPANYGKAEEMASRKMAELGIPGIKYKDQGSRLGSFVRNSKDNTKFEVADDKTGKTIKTFDTLEEANAFKDSKGTSNYVIFDDKLVKIMEYEQRRGKEDPRGRIRFGQERQFNIDLLKNADLSTFIHESGHFYLEVLKDLASNPNASPDIKQDFDTLLKWFNVKSSEEIGVDQHEQFARGFEAYLMEGKAPTPELKSVFDKFKEWLVAIYKEMGNLRVQLTPEVKDVFDRILAGRDEIGVTKAKIKETYQQKDLSVNVYEENRAEVMKGTRPLQVISKDVSNIREDIGKAADKFLGLISTRLKNIDPSLKIAIRNFEYKNMTKTLADMKVADTFMKKKQKMTERDQIDYDLAQKNGDEQVLGYLNMKYGMVGEASLIRNTLNKLHERAREVGFDIGYRANYFPRSIKDPKGFLDYFHRSEEWSIIQEAIQRKETDLGRYLNEDEKAQLINNMIRGYSGGQITLSETGAMKKRKIDFVDADLNRFYHDSDAALVNYIQGTNNAIESRRFFGKGNKEMGYNNIEDSIGAYVLDLVAKQRISPSQEKELRDILSARFSPSTPGTLTSLYKNLAYIDTMGSVTSAITQLSDLAFSIYRAGPLRTAVAYGKALSGKSEIKPADIGIDRIAEEFSDAKKSAAIVGRVFKLIGLQKMDQLGKETTINSTIKKFRDQAKQATPPKRFMEKLKAVFGEETSEVINDLKTDKLTENVKVLAFNELLDVQPVSLSEMPEKYLSGGNGRIFYMLKTYQLKLFDIYRNEVFQKIQQPGIANKIEGMRRLIYLSGAMMLMGATADELKDLILNRKLDWSDRLFENIIKLSGFSRFTLYEAKTEGIASAAAKTILPPFKFLDSLYKDFIKYNPDKFTLEGNFWKNKKLETPASIPLVGKFWYWWFGKGAEKTKKKRLKKAGITLP